MTLHRTMQEIAFCKYLAISIVILTGSSNGCIAATASLLDPIARIEYGKDSGQASVLLKVEGLDAAGLADKALVEKVVDLNGLSEQPAVKKEITAEEMTPAGASSRFWRLTLYASGLSSGTSQSRWMSVVLSGNDVNLPYTLTNGSSAKFNWAVKSVPVLTVQPGQPLPVSISVGPVPASKVKVLQSTLAEKTTKTLFAPDGLRLCKTQKQSDCETNDINLPQNSVWQLFLHGTKGACVYEGIVTIAAFEKPEGESISLTANSSTGERKAWGVGLIFLSATLTFVMTVLMRNKINRNQLILPVSSTLNALVNLQNEYAKGKLNDAAPIIESRIKKTVVGLSMENLLMNGLPSSIPLWGGSTSSVIVDGYRKYVQIASDWTQALSILLHEGLAPAWALHVKSTSPDVTQKAAEAVAAIDRLADVQSPPTTESLRASLHTIIATMNQPADGCKNITGFIDGLSKTAGSIQSPEQLRVEIAGLSLIGWIFLLLITTLSGGYILVVAGPNSLGFGTLPDYFLCILWGFGLPSGTQMLQSTTGSIATTFGVTKPP